MHLLFVQGVLSNKYLIRVGGSKLRFYVRWIFHKMQNHIRRRERSFLYRFFWLQEPGRCLFCLHCSCSECFLSLHCLPVLWWRRWPRGPKVIITGIQSLKFFECQKICLFYESDEEDSGLRISLQQTVDNIVWYFWHVVLRHRNYWSIITVVMLGSGLRRRSSYSDSRKPGASALDTSVWHETWYRAAVIVTDTLSQRNCSVALRYQVVNYTGLQTIQFAINN